MNIDMKCVKLYFKIICDIVEFVFDSYFIYEFVIKFEIKRNLL